MKHQEIIAFPDTNCLLHYPCIKDIDWRSLCDSEFVRIILSRQVIAELDEKKSHPTLRERAERSIKEIKRLLKEGGHVRDKVIIESFKKDIPFFEYPPDLNTDSQDDRIICQVIRCAEENAPIQVIVVSEDLGMELRCETFNIMVVEPPRAERLPNPTTDLERERNKAVKELHQLKNRMPDICVKISPTNEDFENQIKIRLPDRESETINIESEIAHKTAELAVHRPCNQGGNPRSHIDQIGRIFLPSDEEYARHEKDLGIYLKKYRKHLESKARFDQCLLRAFEFWIKIENAGNTPAFEVEISLRFASVLQALFSENNQVGSLPTIEEEPKKPIPPRNIAGFADISALNLVAPNYFNFTPELSRAGLPNVSLAGDDNSGFLLNFTNAKLSHHNPVICGPFMAIMKEGLDFKPFQVTATITADNLAAAVEKKLNILIGK